MTDPAVVADWLMSSEGEAWSRLVHASLADALCESHRVGALFGTLEPPEHEDDECRADCLQTSAKAHHWVPDLELESDAASSEFSTASIFWAYEPDLCDPRVGSPA